MAFTSDEQLASVCRALATSAGLGHLWDEHGPSEDAVALLESDGGQLSTSERALLLLAFCIWNGNARLPFSAVLHLDSKRLVFVGELLLALATGSEAIDLWLSTS